MRPEGRPADRPDGAASEADIARKRCRSGRGRLGLLLDHRFRGDQRAGDRGGLLQRRAHDLGRVDDSASPGREIAGLGIEAEVVFLVAQCRSPASQA
jgi:hypothetical protein